MSKRCARSLSRALGTISLSVKSRAVSTISCCSSVSARSSSALPELALEHPRERLGGLASSWSRRLELDVVDRGDRVDLPHGRCEEGFARRSQVPDLERALLDVELSDQRRPGDRLEDPDLDRRR